MALAAAGGVGGVVVAGAGGNGACSSAGFPNAAEEGPDGVGDPDTGVSGVSSIAEDDDFDKDGKGAEFAANWRSAKVGSPGKDKGRRAGGRGRAKKRTSQNHTLWKHICLREHARRLNNSEYDVCITRHIDKN